MAAQWGDEEGNYWTVVSEGVRVRQQTTKDVWGGGKDADTANFSIRLASALAEYSEACCLLLVDGALVTMVRTDLWKAFFLLLVLFVAVSHGRRRRGGNRYRKGSQSNDFDVLIFTQHWPQTVCYTWKEESANHECALPDNEEWSIHGIWPTKFHVIGPLYCNKTLPFDITALAPLEQELEVKWIDVQKGTKHHSFWTHEWEKHGTCSIVLEPLNSEYKYFKKGLSLLDEYDMKHVLAKATIMPGLAYNVTTILNGVAKVLGKRAQVECVVNPKTKESYLFEVRICFDKKLNLIDCDGIPGYPTNCSKKKDVIYPGSVPADYNSIRI